MKDQDITDAALKHGLPLVWATSESLIGLIREVCGTEWPDEHAFPPSPLSVITHPKLGSMYARFDLQLYALQFENRSRAAISAALGLEGADAGDPNAILAAIEALKATPATAADPRDDFEKLFPLPAACSRCGTGYVCHEFHAWAAHDFIKKFEGFKAAIKLKAGK